MGKWAKGLFGREKFNSIGIVVAGTNKQELEKKVLGMFDEVVSSKDSVYHAHLVKKGKDYFPIVFNIYGAAAMVDVLSEMHDGGCRTVLFIGYAYGGFKNLDVGEVVVATESYHFDGIYHPIEPDREKSLPNKELLKKLEKLFTDKKINYINGTNISVPAVTFQLPHSNEHYQRIKPTTVEMELASCYSRANDLGIRVVGILIISDNKSSAIGDFEKKKLRQKFKMKVLNVIIKNLNYFKLPNLPVKKEFNIDEHLAWIIEDPEDVTNVYRKK